MLVALLAVLGVLFTIACVRAAHRRPAADDGVVRPPGATTDDAVRIARTQIAASVGIGLMIGIGGDGT